MNLKFWKRKTAPESEAPQEEAEKTPAITPERAGQTEDETAEGGSPSRLRAALDRLLSRFRKTPPVPPDEDKTGNKGGEASEDEITAMTARIRAKKRLIIGAIATAALLLLLGAGFAVWKLFLATPEEEAHPAAPESAASPHAPASKPKAPPAHPKKADTDEIEKLKQQNQALQTELDALKNQPDAPSSQEITIGGKDPKAAAQALKQAIEAMNASNEEKQPKKTTE